MRKNLHPWSKHRRFSGLTQEDVADRLGVTRHYIIRLEQSLFWHPPDNILTKLAEIYGVELSTFEEGYYQFVRLQREVFKKTHESFATVLGLIENDGPNIYTGPKHPLVYYREKYELSRMGFCKGLCLHYDPISEYEQNKQRDVPEQLKEACNEMGWSWQAISDTVAVWRLAGYADV